MTLLASTLRSIGYQGRSSQRAFRRAVIILAKREPLVAKVLEHLLTQKMPHIMLDAGTKVSVSLPMAGGEYTGVAFVKDVTIRANEIYDDIRFNEKPDEIVPIWRGRNPTATVEIAFTEEPTYESHAENRRKGR